ncbi:MAG TPA: transposase [Thermoleptolyngbya sp. M55_K2018_002]|nr:hypothetical protein [Thermoleptolyngbya sp. M55_K2018_002]HIK40394.1 transposase [Thermoleptolyngbya sp. M55_K2018_002]
MEVVRQLIAALAGQSVVFTLDALHCQKKRLSRLPNNSSTIQFLQPIQQHWNIENRLHWVRDVTFEEDHARPGGNAPVIWAILNCFIINIVRQLAYRTIPQGIRALTNQVQQVYTILTQGFPPPK